MDIITTRHPDPARAAIAAALARHYSELSGFDDAPAQRFSLSRAIRRAAEGRLDGYEGEVCRGADTLMGRMTQPGRLTIPLQALHTRTMDGSGTSGYLIGARTPTAVDVLRGYSVTVDAGVSIIEGLRENVALPRVTAAGSGAWLAPGDTLPDAQPTLGSASSTPRMGGAIIKLSHQFMRCADEGEAFIRAHLLRAAGELLDRGFFSGAGGKEPLGLYNVAAVHSQDGASLDRADLLAMREVALNGGAREDALRWIGSPDAQELLAARHAVANTFSPLWGDAGVILGRPAHATPTAVHVAGGTSYPALAVGDFSQAQVLFWGPASLQVSVDPYNAFDTGGVAVRVLLLADIMFPVPGAFAKAVQVS